MYFCRDTTVRMFRNSLLACFMLLTVFPFAASLAQEAPSYTPTFEPAPCPFELPSGFVEGETIECGVLTVPENRAIIGGRTIRLAVAILRHPAGTPEPDPIIYLEGGPAGSPLKVRMPGAESFFSPLFAANRDIIIIDQRGVGYSEPALECPSFSELYLDLMDKEVDGQRLTVEQVLDYRVEALTECAAELSQTADLTAYNTAENAADINDLRIALGYEQVNLWGASYGSRLGLEVLRDYPEGLRSIILDAPYTPESDIYLTAPANFDRSLTVLADECAADLACNAAYPDLRAVLIEAMEQLDANPVMTNVIDPYTRERRPLLMDGAMFMEQIFRTLYATNLRPLMPQMIYDARAGQFDTLLLMAQIDVMRQQFRSWGMYFSVLCHDEVPFSTWEEFQTAAAPYPEFAGMYTAFEVGGLPYNVCPDWGAGIADPVENAPIVSDIPVLITTGQYDPIVPPSYGQTATERLTNSYFYVFPGIGHGAIPVDECPVQMMLDFLADPTAAPDSTCIESMTIAPFVVPGEAATAITMVPVSIDILGIQGLVPEGWTEVGPGTFARVSTPGDQTLLIQQAAPTTPDNLLGALMQQFGLSEPPEVAGELSANELQWTLYTTEAQGFLIDAGLAEAGNITLVAVLISPSGEHAVLYEQIFMPAVNALIPQP
jgi:pimeloyl-ACP methyl ester carboxylesterase